MADYVFIINGDTRVFVEKKFSTLLKTSTMNKLFSIVAILFIFISNANKVTAQTASDGSAKTTIKVTNLHCNNDMPTIKKRLLNQDGVEDVTFTAISNESSTFTVTYQNSVTTQDQLEKTIESTPGCDAPDETPYKVKKQAANKKKKS